MEIIINKKIYDATNKLSNKSQNIEISFWYPTINILIINILSIKIQIYQISKNNG